MRSFPGLQIASFIACAVAQGTAFVLWRRKWHQRDKQNSWRLREGWFNGLACLGSVAGALAYGARMGNLIQIYTCIKLESELLIGKNATADAQAIVEQEYSLRHRYAAAFYVMYPWEVALVMLAKLLVLKRMQDFANIRSLRQRAWTFYSRLFLAVVVIGNLIGICSNLVSATFFSQSADFSDAAVLAWAANDTAQGQSFQLKARAKMQQAAANNAVQRFSEASVLLLVVVGFSIVGLSSFRIIASALRAIFNARQIVSTVPGAAGDQSRQLVELASAQGRRLQRKVVGTFVFVFITVLLRSIFYVVYAVASALQNTGDPCGPTCDACRNVYSHIHDWILYTPVVQQVIMLVASPSTLLVALWGMSGVHELEDVKRVNLRAQPR